MMGTEALLASLAPWLLALIGAGALYVRAYLRGRQQERDERELRIHRQAEKAREEARDVEQKNANRTDDDVLAAARRWLRK